MSAAASQANTDLPEGKEAKAAEANAAGERPQQPNGVHDAKNGSARPPPDPNGRPPPPGGPPYSYPGPHPSHGGRYPPPPQGHKGRDRFGSPENAICRAVGQASDIPYIRETRC